MKKSLLIFILAIVAVAIFAFTASAEEITVVDDGTNITLGECVIEGLGREIPSASSGFTFVLDTETKTAKITKWANYADKSYGVKLVIPSYVTYNGEDYKVTTFSRLAYGTDNGTGATNQGNFILTHVYIPDTVVSMPNSAFDNCKALEYVYIGNGLETWGEKAFHFAGTTVGSYYVDDGTGNKVVLEKTGANMGDIKEFILKSKKVTELPKQIFLHTEFDKNAIIEMDITQFKVFGEYCIALNQYALTDDHYFNGIGLFFDVFDIRNAQSIHDNAFYYAHGGKVMIINADQAKYFNINSIRGIGSSYYNKDTANDGLLIICGGETKEKAVTLTGPLWTANPYYWYGSTVFMNVVFKGYVKAYDGVDGLENQNGYGIDQVDYFFDSSDAMNFYFNSISSTTEGAKTLERYAKNGRGYFNVCNGNGTATAYNIKKNADTGAYYIEMWKDNQVTPTYTTIVDGKCTPSTLCRICDCELVKGIEHSLVSKIVYENGYLKAGANKTYCTNDGCNHSVSTTVGALFTSLGYSTTALGNKGIVQGFMINKVAYDAYIEQNPSFAFGVVASSQEKPLDENGSAKDESKTIVVDMSKSSNQAFEIKIIGIGDNTGVGLICCGYVIDEDGLHYLNDGETTDNPTLKSYDQFN
ncbi:MAG: leucine-rich repeat protein [Clostridia bacterium]|nr:leucine-rich repeat protein [Clostridia bacterium]